MARTSTPSLCENAHYRRGEEVYGTFSVDLISCCCGRDTAVWTFRSTPRPHRFRISSFHSYFSLCLLVHFLRRRDVLPHHATRHDATLGNNRHPVAERLLHPGNLHRRPLSAAAGRSSEPRPRQRANRSVGWREQLPQVFVCGYVCPRAACQVFRKWRSFPNVKWFQDRWHRRKKEKHVHETDRSPSDR